MDNNTEVAQPVAPAIQPAIASVPKRSPFLSLPLEIRFMIYREVWKETHKKTRSGDHRRLDILRISKQIMSEASVVLYGENTWNLRIEPGRVHYIDREIWSSCWLGQRLLDKNLGNLPRGMGKQISQMRRFKAEILLKDVCMERPESTRVSLDVVYQILKRASKINYLCVDIRLRHKYTDSKRTLLVLGSVLDQFRNIKTVLIHFGPCYDRAFRRDPPKAPKELELDVMARVWADDMVRKMQGSEPISPLYEMCLTLEKYTKDILLCTDSVANARTAVELGDMESFKMHREVAVKMIKDRVAEMDQHLYLGDPDDTNAEDMIVSGPKST